MMELERVLIVWQIVKIVLMAQLVLHVIIHSFIMLPLPAVMPVETIVQLV